MSSAASAKLTHGVGQLADLALAGITLLLESLALSHRCPAASVHNSERHNPSKVRHDQHDPKNFDLHLSQMQGSFVVESSKTVAVGSKKWDAPCLAAFARHGNHGADVHKSQTFAKRSA